MISCCSVITLVKTRFSLLTYFEDTQAVTHNTIKPKSVNVDGSMFCRSGCCCCTFIQPADGATISQASVLSPLISGGAIAPVRHHWSWKSLSAILLFVLIYLCTWITIMPIHHIIDQDHFHLKICSLNVKPWMKNNMNKTFYTVFHVEVRGCV